MRYPNFGNKLCLYYIARGPKYFSYPGRVILTYHLACALPHSSQQVHHRTKVFKSLPAPSVCVRGGIVLKGTNSVDSHNIQLAQITVSTRLRLLSRNQQHIASRLGFTHQ